MPALLRQLREEAGLTQRALAEKLKTTHVFVHKSEVGDRRVDVGEFMDWATGCGVEPKKAFEQFVLLHK